MHQKNTDCPKVSIIVVTWNKKDELEKCVQSLSNLDYQNYEIIVVDNGSTDGTIEMLRANFTDVNLIVNRENRP